MKFNLDIISDLRNLTKKLSVGLNLLDFDNNIEGFVVKDLEISPDQTISIENKLTFIPTKYIIMSQEGTGMVTKTGVWDKNTLYLKNNRIRVYSGTPILVETDSTSVTITVFFMR